jgi:hypothetical protein
MLPLHPGVRRLLPTNQVQIGPLAEMCAARPGINAPMRRLVVRDGPECQSGRPNIPTYPPP